MNEENIVFEKEKVSEPKQTLLYILVFVIMTVTVINTFFLFYLSAKPKPAVMRQTVESSLELQKQISEYQKNVFDQCVKCSDFEIVKTDYSEHIKGSIKNSSERDLVNIQIMFKCYDSFGDYIGVESVYVNYLPANSTYDIDGYVSNEKADSLRILTANAVYADEIM